MTNITQRELMLAWITGFIILFAGTYILLKPHIDTMADRREQMDALRTRIAKADSFLARQPEWETRLTQLTKTVKPLPDNRPAASYLKKTIGDLAFAIAQTEEYRLTVRESTAGEERSQGGLFKTPVTCQWEGNTAGITKLLVDFLNHDVMFDVTELLIRSSGKDDLKGSLTVNCVYTKTGTQTNETVSAE